MLLAYLYLIRVPLTCALALLALYLCVVFPGFPGANMVSGLFDLTQLEAVAVGFWTAALTAALIITTDITVRCANARFGVGEIPGSDEVARWNRPWVLRIGWVVSVLGMLFTCSFSLREEETEFPDRVRWEEAQKLRNRSAWIAVAYTLVTVLFLTGIREHRFAAFVAYAVAYPNLWFCFRGYPDYNKRLPVLFAKGILFQAIPPLTKMVAGLSKWTPRGYQEDSTGKTVNSMSVYHSGAFQGMVLAVVFYLIAWGWGYVCGEPISALTGVLALLTLLCWTLAGVAFLTDRFRVPLLLVIGVLVMYSGQWPEADHTFPVALVSTNQPDSLPIPAHLAAPAEKIIAVAASGGGIHAAGWTTRVLGGLYLAMPTPEIRAKYARSVRVISSVSGGSVGSLYFLNAYHQQAFRDGTFSEAAMKQWVFDPAVTSSLNEISEKLVFEDLWRTVLPPLPVRVDRGIAAEQAWAKAVPNSAVCGPTPSDQESNLLCRGLLWWGAQAKARKAPAVLFNTTISDTGERAVLASSQLPTPRSGRRLLSELFKDGDRTVDVSLVTAARLSATFPVVSPAATAEGRWPGSKRFHLVDGGYYDNYGMATLVEWLDDALRKSAAQERAQVAGKKTAQVPSPPRVLLVQIRDSPEPKCNPEALGESGFLAQTFAPFQTLMRFRDAGQSAHGKLESELLAEPYSGTVIPASKLGVAPSARSCSGSPPPVPVLFAWPKSETALSWHLTTEDKKEVANAFHKTELTPAKLAVCRFLAQDETGMQPASDPCASLAASRAEARR